MTYDDLQDMIDNPPRHDYTREQIAEIYNMPITQLMFVASGIHQKNHNGTEVQLSNLLSIKTGGCKEKCGYCSQSAHNEAEVDSHGLLAEEKFLRRPKSQGHRCQSFLYGSCLEDSTQTWAGLRPTPKCC